MRKRELEDRLRQLERRVTELELHVGGRKSSCRWCGSPIISNLRSEAQPLKWLHTKNRSEYCPTIMEGKRYYTEHPGTKAAPYIPNWGTT